jgi:hypothetical protein
LSFAKNPIVNTVPVPFSSSANGEFAGMQMLVGALLLQVPLAVDPFSTRDVKSK